jgi:hypothetical protein
MIISLLNGWRGGNNYWDQTLDVVNKYRDSKYNQNELAHNEGWMLSGQVTNFYWVIVSLLTIMVSPFYFLTQTPQQFKLGICLLSWWG